MTGLKNKGALTREINEYLNDTSKDKGIMFLLDINHFKAVNDTYGHDVGDSVISQLGEVLKEIFTDDSIVGRFGGDEFIVFIKNTDSEEVAKEFNIKLLDRLPIDPEMATLCDKGQIEKVADTHLENVLDVLESLEVPA